MQHKIKTVISTSANRTALRLGVAVLSFSFFICLIICFFYIKVLCISCILIIINYKTHRAVTSLSAIFNLFCSYLTRTISPVQLAHVKKSLPAVTHLLCLVAEVINGASSLKSASYSSSVQTY